VIRVLRLSLSFLLIPRLFASLILIPTALSIVLVTAQLILTENMLGLMNRSSKDVKQKLEKTPESQSALRKLVFRTTSELPDLQICRWHLNEKGEETTEDSVNCIIDPYDIVLRTIKPSTLEVEPYKEVFNKNVRRLHICSACRSNIIIETDHTPPLTHTFNIWSLFVLGFTKYRQQNEHILHAFDEVDKVERVVGKRYLHVPGLLNAASLDDLADTAGVIVNIALLIIVALWLALRAHRKVLDYFAASGALLPLVSATGSNVFYGSIWILTLFRVFAFLGTGIPLTYLFLKRAIHSGGLEQLFFKGEIAAFILWLVTLFASFALAGLISSVSDLKHRHAFTSILYKYIPLILTLFGGIVFAATFLIPGATGEYIRTVITGMPLIGMLAILIAPIFIPAQGVLVVNTLLTVALIVPIVKANSRWFAAHLDDL
jgi:hypothetical protein